MKELAGINFGSGDWVQFESFLQTELQDTLKSFMKQGISMEEVHQLRGRAGYIQRLLGLKNVPSNRPHE